MYIYVYTYTYSRSTDDDEDGGDRMLFSFVSNNGFLGRIRFVDESSHGDSLCENYSPKKQKKGRRRREKREVEREREDREK